MQLRRPLLALLLTLAALIVCGLWLDNRAATARRAAAWQARRQILRYYELLDHPIDVPRGSYDLPEYCELLSERSGVPVSLTDWAKEEWASMQPPLRITPPTAAKRLPLRDLLESAIAQQPFMAFNVTPAGIVLNPGASDAQEVVVYPLPMIEGNLKGVSDAWSELLLGANGFMIDTHMGGSIAGNLEFLQMAPGAVLILANPETDHTTAQLLTKIGKLEEQSSDVRPVSLTTDETERDRRVMAALAEETSLKCNQSPLDDVLKKLARKHRIEITINLRLLEEAGISQHTPVTANVRRVSLRSALRIILPDLELTYRLEDGVIQVATPMDANGDYFASTITAYHVHDLLAPHDVDSHRRLTEIIGEEVAGSRWYGKPYPHFFQNKDHCWLILAFDREGQAEATQLLAGLRASLQAAPGAKPIVAEHVTMLEQRVWDALDRDWAPDFRDRPLSKIVADIGAKFDINAICDPHSLIKVSVDPQQPLSFGEPPAPLGMQLRRLLSPLGLMFAVENESLIITTPDRAMSEERFQRRIYDARLLCDPDFGIASQDGLADLLSCAIADEGWSAGAVQWFRGRMLLTQLPAIHEQVAPLLQALEKHCVKGAPGAPASEPPSVVHINHTEADQRLSATLLKKVSVDFHDKTLREALVQLCDSHAIDIDLTAFAPDPQFGAATEEALNETVGLAVEEMTLTGVLDRLLLRRNLSYDIVNGRLRIDDFYRQFGRGSFEKSFFPPAPQRLYWIGSNKEPMTRDPAEVCQAISHRLATDDWGYSPPAIQTVSADWLLIRTSVMLHEEIEDLLSERRTGVKPLRAVERARLTEAELPPGRLTNFGGREAEAAHD